MRKHKN